jgi:hypothetical protein
MKPMAIAALAALATVARIAVAQTTGSPPPVTDPGVRATVEARALVATIQHNAEVIFDSLEIARTRQRTSTIRCVDESLSRADVALRRAREDASVLDAALAAHDAPAMGEILERLRVRASASHEAVVAAASCSPRDGAHSVDRTLVTVIAPRHVARLDR